MDVWISVCIQKHTQHSERINWLGLNSPSAPSPLVLLLCYYKLCFQWHQTLLRLLLSYSYNCLPYGFSFCLIYPSVGAKEVGNPEILMDEHQRKSPTKSFYFSQKTKEGAGFPDRKTFIQWLFQSSKYRKNHVCTPTYANKDRMRTYTFTVTRMKWG